MDEGRIAAAGSGLSRVVRSEARSRDATGNAASDVKARRDKTGRAGNEACDATFKTAGETDLNARRPETILSRG